MSNKHASKQHCLVGNIRPKSKLRKRKNKENARIRREELAATKAPVKAEAKATPEKKETKTEE